MKKIKKTPYILFDKKILEQNYEKLEKACKDHLKDFKIAYSVKTNSYPLLLETLKNLGSGFEIASLQEIKQIPQNIQTIIFNSPAKTDKELKEGIKKNYLINIDSESEIHDIAEITKNKRINAGLRISLKKSKFGFSINKLEETIKLCDSKNIKITSLNFHSGTKQSLEQYKQNLEQIKNIIEKNSSILKNLKSINLGGGLPEKAQLKNLNLEIKDYIKTIPQYLDIKRYKIILEIGRYLVADSFSAISKVIRIKESFNENYAILDLGINFLSKITLANYQFEKISNKENRSRTKKNWTLTGPLLFNNDILGKIQTDLKERDLIKIKNIGAYCYNLAWTISYEKPKIYIKGINIK